MIKSLRQLSVIYYKRILKILPFCDDIDNIIAQYAADLVQADMYSVCLDHIDHMCVLYQVETDHRDPDDSSVVYKNRIPYSVIEYIFYKQSGNIFTIVSFPPQDLYVHLRRYLEECWREIGWHVFRKKPKLIVLDKFSITLDGIKYEGIPVTQDAYVGFSVALESYNQTIKSFCYNSRCLLC